MEEDSRDLQSFVLECLADGEAEAEEGDNDDQGNDWKLHTRELQPERNTHTYTWKQTYIHYEKYDNKTHFYEKNIW